MLDFQNSPPKNKYTQEVWRIPLQTSLEENFIPVHIPRLWLSRDRSQNFQSDWSSRLCCFFFYFNDRTLLKNKENTTITGSEGQHDRTFKDCRHFTIISTGSKIRTPNSQRCPTLNEIESGWNLKWVSKG